MARFSAGSGLLSKRPNVKRAVQAPQFSVGGTMLIAGLPLPVPDRKDCTLIDFDPVMADTLRARLVKDRLVGSRMMEWLGTRKTNARLATNEWIARRVLHGAVVAADPRRRAGALREARRPRQVRNLRVVASGESRGDAAAVNDEKRPPIDELPLTVVRSRRPNAEMLVSVEMLRTMFDLPPEYQWQSTRPDGEYAFQFYVEHLPDIGPFDRPHLLHPTYKVVRAGMVELDSMRVVPSTDRGR